MKVLMRSIVLLPAAMFLTIAIAGATKPDKPDKTVTFSGSFQGKETDVLQGTPPQSIAVDGTLTGVANQLGKFTVKYKVTVKLPEGSSAGFAQTTSADGDILFATVIGLGLEIPGMPGLNRIVEFYTITAGTGRFAGAKGSLRVERLVDLATGLTSGSIQASVIIP